MSETVYLDHNSSTPLLASVADAMAKAETQFFANPESQHGPGRKARRAIETARNRAMQILGAKQTGLDADSLIYTSGVTEANTLALRGLVAKTRETGTPARIAISTIEHPNMAETAKQMQKEGFEVDFIPVDQAGKVNVQDVLKLLDSDTPPQLVCLIAANNETGVIQPIAEVAAECRQRGVLVHTDAAQLVGKMQANFEELDVDTLSFSGHKFNGPNGIGGLLVRHGVTITPQMYGGHQQAGIRPGTESVALSVGLTAALEAWQQNSTDRVSRMKKLRDRLEQGLTRIHPKTVFIGAESDRLPQTCCAAIVGLDRQALVMALDLAGVACSSGSACASGSSEPSPILQAMGLPEEQISSAIRLSLGCLTTEAEIDLALERIALVFDGFPTSV